MSQQIIMGKIGFLDPRKIKIKIYGMLAHAIQRLTAVCHILANVLGSNIDSISPVGKGVPNLFCGYYDNMQNCGLAIL